MKNRDVANLGLNEENKRPIIYIMLTKKKKIDTLLIIKYYYL